MNLGERRYELPDGDFIVRMGMPYPDGADWFCRLWSDDAPETFDIRVGGIDAIQAVRLALQILDAQIVRYPEATYNGASGVV